MIEWSLTHPGWASSVIFLYIELRTCLALYVLKRLNVLSVPRHFLKERICSFWVYVYNVENVIYFSIQSASGLVIGYGSNSVPYCELALDKWQVEIPVSTVSIMVTPQRTAVDHGKEKQYSVNTNLILLPSPHAHS